MRLVPAPGFRADKIKWGGPDDAVSNTCSYCGAPIPEDDVPIRMFSEHGHAAVFCNPCFEEGFKVEGK